MRFILFAYSLLGMNPNDETLEFFANALVLRYSSFL